MESGQKSPARKLKRKQVNFRKHQKSGSSWGRTRVYRMQWVVNLVIAHQPALELKKKGIKPGWITRERLWREGAEKEKRKEKRGVMSSPQSWRRQRDTEASNSLTFSGEGGGEKQPGKRRFISQQPFWPQLSRFGSRMSSFHLRFQD